MLTSFDVNVLPVTIMYQETAKFTETYGFVGSQGMVVLEGMHFMPSDHPGWTTTCDFLIGSPFTRTLPDLHSLDASVRLLKNLACQSHLSNLRDASLMCRLRAP